MMTHGKCPKCSSEEVYVDVSKSKLGRNARDELSVTGMINATLTNYACVACGYTESYLLDEQDRERIKRKWTHFSQLGIQHTIDEES